MKMDMLFAFGGGSRVCIGKNTSVLELTKALPQTVRKFDLMLTRPEEGCKLLCTWFGWCEYEVRFVLRE